MMTKQNKKKRNASLQTGNVRTVQYMEFYLNYLPIFLIIKEM